MKLHYLPVFVLGVPAAVAPAATDSASAATPPVTAPAQRTFSELVELPAQRLVFKPTRDDITVGCVIFSLYCANQSKPFPLDAIRVNGAQPETPTLYLKQVGKTEFELPALKIEFSSKDLAGPLFMSLKPWFNELTNQFDSSFYEHVPDRYALLSYCTKEDASPDEVNARLGANRAATLQEFKDRLAKPLVIKLNAQALREEWGRYPMLPPGDRLSPAELRAVEQAVRDRGENFVTAISVSDADHAAATVGDRTFFQPARVYQISRSAGKWQVDSVKNVKASFR